MSDLRSQINNLSAAEKAELLDTVWESLEGDAASLTDAQRAELDYRISRHEQDPSGVIPWQQVKTNLFYPRAARAYFLPFPSHGVPR
jgi:putative addiction module component (TIGR02574 family)